MYVFTRQNAHHYGLMAERTRTQLIYWTITMMEYTVNYYVAQAVVSCLHIMASWNTQADYPHPTPPHKSPIQIIVSKLKVHIATSFIHTEWLSRDIGLKVTTHQLPCRSKGESTTPMKTKLPSPLLETKSHFFEPVASWAPMQEILPRWKGRDPVWLSLLFADCAASRIHC